MSDDDNDDFGCLPDLAPAGAPTPPNTAGPPLVPVVFDVDVEADEKLIDARETHATLAARHAKVWRQVQALRVKAGLSADEPIPSERNMPAHVAKAIRAGKDIDPAAVSALRGFALAETELRAALSASHSTLGDVIAQSMSRAGAKVLAAVADETADLAAAWVELLRRGKALNEKLSEFRTAGWHTGWRNVLPALPLHPAESLAVLPATAATKDKLRALVAAGALTAGDVADLL